MVGYPPMMPPGMFPQMPPGAQPMIPPFVAPNMYAQPLIAPVAPTSPPKSSENDWVEYKTPQGQPYYFNKVTKITQWTKPQELIDAESATTDVKETNWVEYFDQKTGKPYYYNSVTQKSEWTMPLEYKRMLMRTRTNSIGWKESQKKSAVNSPPKVVEEVVEEPVRSRSPGIPKNEAIRIFKQLLEESGVEPEWDWNRTMKVIIKDDRYKVLKNVRQKTDVFNEYVEEKRQKDREERRERERKGRHDFMEMLNELTDLTPRTHYHSIISKVENDPRYQSVREHDRVKMFDEHLGLLEKKEREAHLQKRELAMTQFRQLLERKAEEGVINDNSTLRRAAEKLENEEAYKALDNYDRVRIWDHFIGELQRKEDERRAQEKLARKKKDKDNRAKLWDLFLNLQKEGKIDVLSSWKEVKPIVQESTEFKEVEENHSGPKSHTLFNEFLEELEKQYKRDKKLFKSIIKENKLTITEETNYDEWHLEVSKDERFSQLHADNVKILFEESVDKSSKRARRRKKGAEKFLKMLDETIKYYHFNPNTITYESILTNIHHKPAFDRVRTDEERRELFKQYVQSQQEPKPEVKPAETPVENAKRPREEESVEDQPPQKKLKEIEDTPVAEQPVPE
jgi:pre-mRNA-processing factor 40